jgi:hypothetical protein
VPGVAQDSGGGPEHLGAIDEFGVFEPEVVAGDGLGVRAQRTADGLEEVTGPRAELAAEDHDAGVQCVDEAAEDLSDPLSGVA